MAKKAESRLQQRIAKALKTEGCKVFKVHGSMFQEAGQPDLHGVIDGPIFGIPFKFEVKIPLEGKPSDIQLQTLIEWREVGALACIVESPSQAVALVKAAKVASGKRYRGDRLYRWICRTLRATHGQDMGYGRSPRGRKGYNSRRSSRWALNQLRKHLGEIPGGEASLVLGAP